MIEISMLLVIYVRLILLHSIYSETVYQYNLPHLPKTASISVIPNQAECILWRSDYNGPKVWSSKILRAR